MEALRQLWSYPLFRVGEGALFSSFSHPCLYAGSGNNTFTGWR